MSSTIRKMTAEDAGGFTLLEVLIALAILSGVVVTVLTVLNTHLAAATRLSARGAAMSVAAEKIEQVRLYGAVPASPEEEPGYGVKYTEEKAVSGLVKVCVDVSWGVNEQVGLCAYVPPKG